MISPTHPAKKIVDGDIKDIGKSYKNFYKCNSM